MTGQRYQCQECEEIFVMPIEFETTEEYLKFLKVQSPKKFAELKAVLERTQSKRTRMQARRIEPSRLGSFPLSERCVRDPNQVSASPSMSLYQPRSAKASTASAMASPSSRQTHAVRWTTAGPRCGAQRANPA